MAENSNIEWTDHTFNPWRGCTKVSPGCANCYADTMSKRNPGTLGVWGPNGTRVVAAESYWRQALKWDREAAAAGERRRVFCASMADVFEDWQGPMLDSQERPLFTVNGDEWFTEAEYPDCRPLTMDDVRRRLFALIDATPNLDWILLTKRPENIARMMPSVNCDRCFGGPCDPTCNASDRVRRNLWLGTSVENQATADERIPHLLRVPAAVRFLSCEPLLGPVTFRWAKWCPMPFNKSTGVTDELDGLRMIDWVIVGGESGPKARPMHPQWARDIRDQCQAAGVPFFFKQWGEYIPMSQQEGVAENGVVSDGANGVPERGWPMNKVHHWSGIEESYRCGKKAAGRLLDGREWSEFPQTEVAR